MGDLVRLDMKGLVPAVVVELGRKAERTFVEFFTAHLSNDHTRRAYAHAAADLSEWLALQGWSLAELEPIEAATYIESLKKEGKATSPGSGQGRSLLGSKSIRADVQNVAQRSY